MSRMGWINKNDNIPEHEPELGRTRYVLVTDGEEIGIGCYYYEYKYWVYSFAGFNETSDNKIIKWMELPKI